LLQTNDWQLGEPIGLGISGLILAATNPVFPNAILKKGSALHLDHEAEKLWVVRHPNVAQLYGMLGSHEDQPDGRPTAYLALKREGPDLATLLNDPSHGWLPCPLCFARKEKKRKEKKRLRLSASI